MPHGTLAVVINIHREAEEDFDLFGYVLWKWVLINEWRQIYDVR